MTDKELRPNPMFTAEQLQFFWTLATEIKSGSVHILRGPTGCGKSTVIAGTIAEMVRANRLKRVLIVAPAALAEQWGFLLQQDGQSAVVLNAQTVRLLREQVGDAPDKWPNGVYSISIDLAKRSDVRELLVTCDWDLVVVDEAHRLAGQRLELVESLASANRTPAFLLATSSGEIEKLSSLAKASIVDWSHLVAQHARDVSAGGAPLVANLIRSYRRSNGEVSVARKVVELARRLGPAKGMVLLHRASSSVSSLEDTLVRWVEQPEGPREQIEGLESLLQEVEELHTDARLQRFISLINELVEGRVSHVAAFCDYRTTLEYLAAAVEQCHSPAHVLHGDMDAARRVEIVSRFEKAGGLLIMTGAVLEGLSLGFVGAAIHYDFPASLAAFAQREGRYLRYGRTAPCTVYFFRDDTGALPLEDLMFQAVQRHQDGRGGEDPDPDELFQAAVR